MRSTFRPLLRGMRNAGRLLLGGRWREFSVRARISLGIVDLKDDPAEAVSERTHYYADSGGLAFEDILSHFSISKGDAIVDFGCGKGGVLISLSKYPFAKITGVEISQELADIARNNLQKLKISNVDVEQCDAGSFVRLEEYNYFYFFDPFPAVVMQDVIKNIKTSIINKPRKVTVIYMNPFCHDLFDESEIFEKTMELPHFEHKCFVYSSVR